MSKKPAVVKSELNLPQCESGSARFARSTTAYGPLSEFRGGRPLLQFSRVCNELLLSLVIYNRIKKRLKFVKESRVQLESSFLSFMISPKGTKDRNEDTKGNRHRKPKKKDLSIMNVPTA